MKNLLLLTLSFPVFVFSQTITTTGSGDYYNPSLWDCFCVPSAGVDAIINHDMTTDIGILLDGGSMVINSGASVTVTAGGTGVYVSNSASLTNSGSFNPIAVTFTQGTTINSSGVIVADSLLNQGDLDNSGTMTIYDITNDEVAEFTNTGSILITHDFNNQGLITNLSDITVENDFSNCNTQALDAMFINNGTMCVANDFANCDTDTLAGSGQYYAGGLSGNYGVFDGTHTFNTPSGSLSINAGVIAPSVTITSGSGACFLGVEEQNQLNFNIYPNPTTGKVMIDYGKMYSTTEIKVFDILGQIVLSQSFTSAQKTQVEINELPGIYFIEIQSEGNLIGRRSIIKK